MNADCSQKKHQVKGTYIQFFAFFDLQIAKNWNENVKFAIPQQFPIKKNATIFFFDDTDARRSHYMVRINSQIANLDTHD